MLNSARRLTNSVQALCVYTAVNIRLTTLHYTQKAIRLQKHCSIKEQVKSIGIKKLSDELGIGEMTLADIINELAKPGRDPRDELPPPLLRTDVADINSLKPGMILDGTVRNVIDFGVFVDIGVHQDGLVHISQICDKYIKHPLEVVKVGDIVKVKVLDIDPAKKRISLTMKGV